MATFRQGDFDSATWPASATMAAGDVTEWVYDAASGMLTDKVDETNHGVHYEYDDAGRLRSRRAARGDNGLRPLTVYSYEPTGELATVDYKIGMSAGNSSNDPSTPDVTYAYDSLGRVEEIHDAVGQRNFEYDPDTLRLVREVIDGQGEFDGIYDVTISRKYEGQGGGKVPGRPAGLTLNDGRYDVTHSYKPGSGRFGAVSWTVDGVSDTAEYGYLANSELLDTMTTLTGQTVSYAYEPHRNLRTQVKNEFSGAVVSQYDYAYDDLGRRQSVGNLGSAFGAQAFTKWGYDDRNQVTSSHRYPGPVVGVPPVANEITDERRSYVYDPIGNRETTTAGAGAEGISSTYYPNELNQYDGAHGLDIAHDDDGNLISYGTRGFTYNGDNRLITADVFHPGVPDDGISGFEIGTTYVYDYMGRRVQQHLQDHNGGGTIEATYIYDGWNVVKEQGWAGDEVAFTKRYVWGLDLSQSPQGAGGIGGLLAVLEDDGSETEMVDRPVIEWNQLNLPQLTGRAPTGSGGGNGRQKLFAYDGNGNVGQLIGAADGVLDATYEYDAFGNVIASSGDGAFNNRWQFSTKPLDWGTGLNYYGYRYYDTGLGRWLRRDPIGTNGGLNLYALGTNAPVSQSDPLGLYLLAMDGTDNGWAQESNVRFFAERYLKQANDVTIGGKNYYYRGGPGSDGSVAGTAGGAGSGGLAMDAANAACRAVNKGLKGGGQAPPIDIVGFSRGAAIANEIAWLLNTRGCDCGQLGSASATPTKQRVKPKVRFLGLFDPVHSMGTPHVFGNTFSSRPATVLFSGNSGWHSREVAPNVRFVADAKALDEGRTYFRYSDMRGTSGDTSYARRWFRGRHSDVGGHSSFNLYLRLLSLRWMIGQATDRAGVNMRPVRASEVRAARRDYGTELGPQPTWVESGGGVYDPLDIARLRADN